MVLQLLEPQKPYNKAFLKIKANREPLVRFKVKLFQFSNSNNENESEKFHNNLFQDFLEKTFTQSTILFTKAVAPASLYFKNYSTCLH